MKKSLIAGAGVAALSMAALPFAGVFAEATHFTDQVQVTVEKGCSFEVTDGSSTPAVIALTDPRVFSDTATLGEVVTLGGSNNLGASSVQNIAVSCSADAATDESWSITAKGGHYVDSNFTASTSMAATNGGTAITTDSAHTAETTGATSYWSFRIDTTASSSYKATDTWYAIPAAGAGTGGADVVVASATADKDANVAFTPSYRVYVGTAQEADTYTGYVTYTIADTFTNN